MACSRGFPVYCHSRQVQSCNSVFTTCLHPILVSLTSAPHNEDFSAHKCAKISTSIHYLLDNIRQLVPLKNIGKPSSQLPQPHYMILIWSTMSWTGKYFNSFNLLLKLSTKLLLIWSHLMAVLNLDLYHNKEWYWFVQWENVMSAAIILPTWYECVGLVYDLADTTASHIHLLWIFW
jgi:hypothetical protein